MVLYYGYKLFEFNLIKVMNEFFIIMNFLIVLEIFLFWYVCVYKKFIVFLTVDFNILYLCILQNMVLFMFAFISCTLLMCNE